MILEKVLQTHLWNLSLLMFVGESSPSDINKNFSMTICRTLYSTAWLCKAHSYVQWKLTLQASNFSFHLQAIEAGLTVPQIPGLCKSSTFWSYVPILWDIEELEPLLL